MRRLILRRSSGNVRPVIGKLAKKSECVRHNELNNAFERRLRFATLYILLTSNLMKSSLCIFGRDRGNSHGSSSSDSGRASGSCAVRRQQQHNQRSIAEADGRWQH